MSLIQRVTALAQAVAADIKALYAGKAEKEHTHTAAQVSGLGTAATRDVGEGTGNVLERGSFGLGHAERAANFAERIDSGFYLSAGATGMPPGMVRDGGWMINLNWHIDDTGNRYNCSFYGNVQNNFIGFRRINLNGVPHAPVELHHSGNILTTTGQSTNYPMTQKAVTDAINARGFADASGILTATSGALSNDMSSYLSSKTYAEMRTKLGVAPVEVVQGKGQSTTDVVSQKAVTDAFKVIEDALGFLLEEEGEGGTLGFWIDGLSSAIDEYRNELIGKIDDLPTVSVVQESGTSSEAVMSQEAVTYSLKRIEDRLEKLEFAMTPIIYFDGEMGTIGYWLNQSGGQ